MAYIKTLPVDCPDAILSSWNLLPQEVDAQLKDVTDRHLDFALHKVHEATALSRRAACPAAFCARACIVWLDDLLQNPPQDIVRLRQTLNKSLKAQAFFFFF
ncbi:Hypothetical predicted protein [Podarcis lilfordi]|uniref:Uncharacterized protein n=1 Tax=Podarcis lilfordi TaxID=74358 RepID=A0AA35PH45_9SAUR|nr:Hypothetical predicted protein [Podarcis lilfordi]